MTQPIRYRCPRCDALWLPWQKLGAEDRCTCGALAMTEPPSGL